MRKITISGEEIKVKPFVLKAGDEREVIAEIRATVRAAVNLADELTEEIKDMENSEWRYGARNLLSLLGRSSLSQLAKAARNDEEWVEKLSAQDTLRLIFGVYAENEDTYKQIFREEFSVGLEDPAILRLSCVSAKLMEYGYSQSDIQNMTFEEIASLYKDLSETDLKKREKFLRMMKEILETPFIQTLTK